MATKQAEIYGEKYNKVYQLHPRKTEDPKVELEDCPLCQKEGLLIYREEKRIFCPSCQQGLKWREKQELLNLREGRQQLKKMEQRTKEKPGKKRTEDQTARAEIIKDPEKKKELKNKGGFLEKSLENKKEPEKKDPLRKKTGPKKNPIVQVALAYIKRGWPVIPFQFVKDLDVKQGKLTYDKRPLAPWLVYRKELPTKETVIEWWEEKYPEAGIGLVCGPLSGIIVLDIDSKEGEDYLKEKGVPLTPCVKTYRGRHLYFKHPGFEVKNFVKKHGLDLRGDFGYAALPPTKDPRGGAYTWQIGLDETEIAEAPEWLLGLIKEEKETKKLEETKLTKLLLGVKKGSRHDTATKLAGHWLGKRLPASEALSLLKDWNKKNKPPLPEPELQQIIQDFEKKEPELKYVDRKLIKRKRWTVRPDLINLVQDGDTIKWLLKNKKGNLYIKKEEIMDSYNNKNEIVERLIKYPRQKLSFEHATPKVLEMQGKVKFDELLLEVLRFIESYVEISDPSYILIMALFIFHSYLMDKFETTPIIYYYGAHETGKSRAGEILKELSLRGFFLTTPTEASIFREAEHYKTCIIIDETKLGGWHANETVRDLIHSRYKKGIMVCRVDLTKEGEDQLQYYQVFGPTVLCTTKPIDVTLKSRCIEFVMQENQNPKVEEPIDHNKAQELRNKLTIFRAKYMGLDLPKYKRVAPRRLNELLLPLYQILMVIDQTRKKDFDKIIKTLQKRKVEERGLALEAVILELIIKKLGGQIGLKCITTEEITKGLNEGVEEQKDKVSIRYVGMVCNRLGFETWIDKEMTKRKRGYRIKKELLKSLCQKYEIEHSES